MNKLYTLLAISFFLMSSSTVFANHCSGGHEEIKETKETSTENDKKE